MEFLTKNNSSSVVTLLSFSSEYLRDSVWVPCNYTSWGRKQSAYYYSCQNRPDDMFDIGPGEVTKMALRAQIKLPMSPFLDQRPRRIHSSLPAPLKIRFSWTDSDKRSSSIIVCESNPLPSLRDRSFVEKTRGLPTFLVACCDDVSLAERVSIIVRAVILGFRFLFADPSRVGLRRCRKGHRRVGE